MKLCILLRTLKVIQQNKEVLKISGKRYAPYNVEIETFSLFTGLTKPYIKYAPGIE